MAVHGADKIPGMFTSYWYVTEAVYEGEEFYGKGFGAEGSKGGANGSPTFQRPNSWYRMVMRTFPPTRGVYYTWTHCALYAKRQVGTSNDRLFTAVGARPFDKWSKFTCAAPFSGKEKSPVYFTKERSRDWSELSDTSQIVGDSEALALNAGISCLLPDAGEDNTLYLCNRHGVFKTADSGKSYRLVLRTPTR